MGLFGTTTVAPPPEEPKYTIEKVQQRLDAFGLKRLEVRDAGLKVLISKVTWGALPYLNRISGGKPNGGHIAEMLAKLEMLTRVLDQYVMIQEKPDDFASKGDPVALLTAGSKAIEAYLTSLGSGSNSQDLFDYTSTTDFLSGNVSTL